MNRRRLLASVAAIAVPAAAHAWMPHGDPSGPPPATAVAFTPDGVWTTVSANHYSISVGALSAGGSLGTVTISPSNWNGVLASSGLAVTISGTGATRTLVVGTGGWSVANGGTVTLTADAQVLVLTFDVQAPSAVLATSISFTAPGGWATVSANHYSIAIGALVVGSSLGTVTVAPSNWNSVLSAVASSGAVTVSGTGATRTLAVGAGGWSVANGRTVTLSADAQNIVITFDVLTAQAVGTLAATYVVPNGPQVGTYVYSLAGGSNQTVITRDNYVDPDGAFVMTCAEVRRSDAAMTVIFRTATGTAGTHDQIIFECCNAFATTDQTMTPNRGSTNTVTISRNGTPVGSPITGITGHWARGRWRWQSSVWPFMKDVAMLRAQRRLPAWDPNVYGAAPAVPGDTAVATGPMGLPSGWVIDMQQGGAPDVWGGWDGYWANYGTPTAFAKMLGDLEARGIYPWFYRDPTTGAVPDIWRTYKTKTDWSFTASWSTCSMNFTGTPNTTLNNSVIDEFGQTWYQCYGAPAFTLDGSGQLNNYPMWSPYGTQATPGPCKPSGPLTLSPPNADVTSVTVSSVIPTSGAPGTQAYGWPSAFVQGSGLAVELAHATSLWSMCWIGSGDPYHLEALHSFYATQATTNWAPRQLPRDHLWYGQIRGVAWQLSTLMLSAATTPYVTPSWILPRSLWQQLWADEERLLKSELIGGPTPGSTLFHSYGPTVGGGILFCALEAWMESMVLAVTSWVAGMMPTARYLPQWHSVNHISRLGGYSSGWPPNFPESYGMDEGTNGYWNDGLPDGVWFTSWVEAYNYNTRWRGPESFPALPGALTMPFNTDLDNYKNYLGFALRMAKHAGVTGLEPYLTDFISKMRGVGLNDGWNRLVKNEGLPVASTITGATIQGVTHAPDTLANLVTATTAGQTLALPAGFWTSFSDVGAASTIQGVRINQTIIDATGLSITNGKAIFRPTAAGATFRNMTIMGASVPDGDGAGIREQSLGLGWTAISCEFTGNQNGVLSAGSDITMTDCFTHENGTGDALTHEMYFNGTPSTTITLNNHTSACGVKSTHAFKSRAGTNTINGGSFAGNPEPTGDVAGSVIDISQGGITNITDATIILAGPGSITFIGFAPESGANNVTGQTLTLTRCRLINYSGVTGEIRAWPGNSSQAHLVLVNTTYEAGKPNVSLQGWASITGALTAA